MHARARRARSFPPPHPTHPVPGSLSLRPQHAAYRGFILQNLVPVKGGGYEWRCNVPVLLKALPQFAAFRAGEKAARRPRGAVGKGQAGVVRALRGGCARGPAGPGCS